MEANSDWTSFEQALSKGGSSLKLDQSYFDWLHKQYKFISSREQYADISIDGAPSWVSWWMKGMMTGKEHAWFNKESLNNNTVLRDTGGIAPLNLTMDRVLYFKYDAPAVARRRFIAVIFALAEAKGRMHKPLPIAIQYAAIAALPAPIMDAQAHDDLWKNFRVGKYWKNFSDTWGRPVSIVSTNDNAWSSKTVRYSF